jgi:DNA-binding CsgD family transcriptional regulator
MAPLTEQDQHASLQLLRAASAAGGDTQSFARACIDALPALVASEITTLSICDLRRGQRTVIGSPDNRLSAQDRACFDRHFDTHPLVRFHAHQAGRGARRISDSIPFTRFRETALYDEYYRRIRIDHALALPIQVDAETLVSLVLNRRRRDFSERDCAVLELVREPLSQIYRHARALERARATLDALLALNDVGSEAAVAANAAPLPRRQARAHRRPLAAATLDSALLTGREREVIHWVAAGKTDRDVGALLGCSHRTVQKHLEHIYAKLGVETRTAAVMRALKIDLH